MKNTIFKTILILVMLFCISNLQAQISDKISIHGFGGWAAGITDNNNIYLLSSEKIEYNNYNFSLNIAAQPSENFSIHSQLFWSREIYNEKIEIDYIFAQYYYSSLFTVRVGKVKSPMGLYSEIYDVGTLRPFYLLPVGMYNGPGQFPKSYVGLGLTGRINLQDNWEITYDFIAGEIEFPDFQMEIPVGFDPLTYQPIMGKVNYKTLGTHVVGLKISLTPSIQDLNIGFAYINLDPFARINNGPRDRIKVPFANTHIVTDRLNIVVGHFEYLTDHISLRSEIFKVSNQIELGGGYVEAAYIFFKNLQLAVDYDWYASKKKGAVTTYPVESVFNHKNIGLGLNYWFNPNLVLKSSFYMINGNGFAQPEKVIEKLPGRKIKGRNKSLSYWNTVFFLKKDRDGMI